MEQNYISNDVFEQIKDFDHHKSFLTKEQKLLIDKLIPNKELKQRYVDHGLCKGCKQPNTGYNCIGVNHVIQNVSNKVSKTGLVEILTLIN